MPTYLYETVLPSGEAGEQVEIVHAMDEPPPMAHPENGLPLRRVFTAPHVATRYTAQATQSKLSDKHLSAHGFAKYVKKETGVYEKTTR
jgi:predicted nucleic acid-binding Zn ribbon protein